MSSFDNLRLSPWYLNTRRLNPLCGNRIPPEAQVSITKNSAERAAAMSSALWAANSILGSTNVKSLFAVYDNLSSESFTYCYIWDVLVFRGVGTAFSQERSGGSVTAASFDGKVQVGLKEVTVYGQLSNDHLYSVSSTTLMSGRKRALIFGQMRVDEEGNVEVHPVIVGDMVAEIAGMFSQSWRNMLRVYPESVDAFSDIKTITKVTAKEARIMLQISEEEVKLAIADIIGEPFIPKDWGGEKSDLSTNNLSIGGTSSSAAFVLKGPSVPGPLYINNMGKRGDQLVRAFDEPVDVIFIQHCAKIDNSVVRATETFAANPSNPKRYCILDGADTFRLLNAYGKIPARISN